MVLRWTRRLVSIVVLLVALIFFEALLIELGWTRGVRALPTAVPAAAEFTVDYLKSLARGDLGVVSPDHRAFSAKPVIDELHRALPLSLGLLGVSLALAALVGLLLGVAAALWRHRRLSGPLLFTSVLGISTPGFFAGMLLIWLGVWLYRRTGTHFFPIAGAGWDAHLLLPSIVLATRPTAAVTRFSYNALVEILDADHVRTARGKGLASRQIVLRHVLRNAGVPILTTVGVSVRYSLAVLPLAEYIFSWPGIGLGLLKAIQRGDTNGVIGLTLPLALLFVLVDLFLDIGYVLLDPRLRVSKGGAA